MSFVSEWPVRGTKPTHHEDVCFRLEGKLNCCFVLHDYTYWHWAPIYDDNFLRISYLYQHVIAIFSDKICLNRMTSVNGLDSLTRQMDSAQHREFISWMASNFWEAVAVNEACDCHCGNHKVKLNSKELAVQCIPPPQPSGPSQKKLSSKIGCFSWVITQPNLGCLCLSSLVHQAYRRVTEKSWCQEGSEWSGKLFWSCRGCWNLT